MLDLLKRYLNNILTKLYYGDKQLMIDQLEAMAQNVRKVFNSGDGPTFLEMKTYRYKLANCPLLPRLFRRTGAKSKFPILQKLILVEFFF